MLRRMPRTAIPITGLALAVALGLPTSVRAQSRRSAPVPDFERDVLPILTANCVKCHGADKPQAGLDLRTPASILRGGDSGPALLKTAAERSLLWAKVSKGEMPPDKAKKLTATQIQALRDWIDAGAPGSQGVTASPGNAENQLHWAFRRLSTPRVPHVAHRDRARTPVDHFLLAQLEPKGLSFAADADRATLLRRVCFDLWGLPPTPEELDAFAA